MPQQIAVVRNDTILEIVERRPRGKDIVRGKPGDGTRLVDITGTPHLKVGDYWGPDPEKWVYPPTEPSSA